MRRDHDLRERGAATGEPRDAAAALLPSHTILLVDDEESVRKLISIALRRAGYEVAQAADGAEAIASIAAATPDLVLSDVMMPRMSGFELLAHLRADPSTQEIPVILLTARGTTDDVVAGLGLGADDYLAKPFNITELLARVRSKIERPPVPADSLPRDRRTGLLTQGPFLQAAGRELERAARSDRPGALAYIALEEVPRLRDRLGPRSEAALARQVAAVIAADAGSLELIGRDDEGRFMLLLPEFDPGSARQRLAALAQRIVQQGYSVGEERLRVTPSVGYAMFAPEAGLAELRDRALLALSYAAAHLDLQPVRYERARHGVVRPAATHGPWARFLARARLPVQIAVVQLLALVLPFTAYVVLDRAGLNIVPALYIVVVLVLLITAALIWIEGFRALRAIDPLEPGLPYPSASAIIAAYLPNEAATVTETIEAFLRVDYDAPLQVILAYNTPRDLPIEVTLRAIARRDPRFLPLRVEGSTSKAQNVNAALAEVTGEFVGVFDADHQPEPGSFRRAWRWLASGYDVVQGHCLIRNGDESWVARMVAVEFEGIYAVSHPGRARLHHFGIFGGSNGYWRTDLLRRIRIHGFMLTEDIDSSLRVTEEGGRIASDPFLISRELAPVTLRALTNQRLRWAQGWFQVALKHTGRALRSRSLSVRQKLGMLHLLAWREIYPLISVQMFPIVAFWIWQDDGADRINWLVPIFVITSLFTLTTGPGQVLFAYQLAAPEIRRRRRWFLFYLVVSAIFYGPFKNLLAVVAQIKELMRERAWKVTPRAATKEAP